MVRLYTLWFFLDSKFEIKSLLILLLIIYKEWYRRDDFSHQWVTRAWWALWLRVSGDHKTFFSDLELKWNKVISDYFWQKFRIKHSCFQPSSKNWWDFRNLKNRAFTKIALPGKSGAWELKSCLPLIIKKDLFEKFPETGDSSWLASAPLWSRHKIIRENNLLRPRLFARAAHEFICC